jgi:hypothetical protein
LLALPSPINTTTRAVVQPKRSSLQTGSPSPAPRMPERKDIAHVEYAIQREVRMKAVIDRIEGKLAVLLMGEDGSIKVNMPLILLPEGCKEGDVLDITISRNENATSSAKDRSKSLIEKLKRKGQDKGGIIHD